MEDANDFYDLRGCAAVDEQMSAPATVPGNVQTSQPWLDQLASNAAGDFWPVTEFV